MGVNDVRRARARAGRWYTRGKGFVMDRDVNVEEVGEAELETTAPRRANEYVCAVRVLM